MKKLYQQLSLKKFVVLSIICAILGDILIFSYTYLKFSSGLNTYTRLLKIALEQNNIDFSTVDKNFIREQFLLYCQLVLIAIAAISLFHATIYVLHYFGKKGSWFYLQLYSVIAAPGCFLMSLTMLTGDPLKALIFLIQSGFYLFIFVGLRTFKSERFGTD